MTVHCEQLLRATYKGEYDLEQKMSVMLSFDPMLWNDEDYHDLKKRMNPYWSLKKEVCTSPEAGHGCVHASSNFARRKS